MGLFNFNRKKGAEQDASAGQTAFVNDEIIAVLAAAIAAYEAEQYRPSLSIKKINRSAGVRPVWGAAGTNEAIDVRRI